MALERCKLTWPDGDTFHFLSPDGDRWLEVTDDSYHQAPDHAGDVVTQLTDKLEGRDGTMRIRVTRGYLQRWGATEGYAVMFD